jgi:hypothetical protein
MTRQLLLLVRTWFGANHAVDLFKLDVADVQWEYQLYSRFTGAAVDVLD